MEGIFLTCHANFAYAQEAVKLNCQDYVLMPARNEEIGRAVSDAVLRAQEKRKNRQLEEYGERWLKSKQQEARELQGEKREPGEIVAECIQYILDNLDNPELSVNKVAANCYLNPIYLNRIFKKEKEISIGQFIIREKMVLAARLFQEGGLSAATVAAKVGYPNYPYFSTAFKKYFGCSPQQYKEERDKAKEEGSR